MSDNSSPRPYKEWRTDLHGRAEDAAYTFGNHLIVHCRDEALNSLPAGASSETKAVVEEAIDTALHNVMDMLEGFWKLDAGAKHTIDLVLNIRVHNSDNNVVESIEISPNLLDLPVGYWKWAKDRKFRSKEPRIY